MMSVIKNIINFIKNNTTMVLLIIIALMFSFSYSQCSRIIDLESENESLLGNQKAYENENYGLKKKNYEFQMSVKQLKASNDTITQELMKTKKELGIKDKEIKALAYLASKAGKTDTLRLSDTIFRDPLFLMDTTLSDEWYSSSITLRYPGDIIVSSSFNSQKELFVSARKETINKPRKFIVFRWFQKKHVVTDIIVVEKNPYITNDTERFIKIIK